MFENILVPTDLTENSRKALDIAVKLASNEDAAKITLLHVVETIEGAGEEEFKDFYERLEKRAAKGMEKMADEFRDRGISIDWKILYGNRVREIVKFAFENDISLIILSSHRIDEVDSAQGWATISYRVGILANCPVMMVK